MNIEARIDAVEAIERIAERLVTDMSGAGESVRNVAACAHVVSILECARKARLLLRAGASGMIEAVREPATTPDPAQELGTSGVKS